MRNRRPDVTAADVYRFSRDEFIEDYWEYGSTGDAEHACFIGMTRSGKTTLMFELLDVSTETNPELGSTDGERIAIVLVMKPYDETPEKWGKRLGYKRIEDWPPPMMRTQRKYNIRNQPPGYLLWPKLGNLKTDNNKLRKVFDHCLTESYAQAASKNRQERIIVADEVIGLQRISNADYPLKSHLDDIYERGAGMGLGQWSALQKPFNAPTNAYENSVHLFLWRSNDRRNLKRFSEVGGIDGEVIDGIVSTLQGRDCLYINRSLIGDEREYYIVGQD